MTWAFHGMWTRAQAESWGWRLGTHLVTMSNSHLYQEVMKGKKKDAGVMGLCPDPVRLLLCL